MIACCNMAKNSLSHFSGLRSAEKAVVSLADKFNNLFANERLITFKYLRKNLDTDQRKLIDWLLDLKPGSFGLKTPFYGIEEPVDSMHFSAQTYLRHNDNGKSYKVTQYVPAKVYLAFRNMNQAFVSEYPKQRMLIASAYRSPAYQTMLIIYYVKQKKFNLTKVLNRVALPGYSEHGLINQTALDLEDSWDHPKSYDDVNFCRTVQYRWLIKNAQTFDFGLSYPKDNSDGIDFEPWHWRYLKNV